MRQVKTLLNFVKRRKRFPLTERTDTSRGSGLPATDQSTDSSLLVTALYRAALGRRVDKEALANAIQQLGAGMSLENLAENLVCSAEFSARHGPSQWVDRNFITALYRDGLGREADPEGLTSWLTEGEKGATRAKVLAAFASSTEAIERHRKQLVDSFYRAAFGRPADPQGLADRIQQLQSGVSLEALAVELVGSAEFQTRHGSSQTVDNEYLAALYRDGLGRQPDPEGLTIWLAEGEKGATRAMVLAAFAGSEEALEKAGSSSLANLPKIGDPSLLVNSLYKTAFGRLADPDGLAHCVHQLQSAVSLEDLAGELVTSAEFQARHGAGQRVDIKYLTALCRDGLGGQPDLESLASWLPERRKGATRAKALAAVARSAEALERAFPSTRDGDTAYSRWIAVNDTLGNADRAAIRAHIAGLPFRPFISVIMPIGRISEVVLRESLNSLVTQLYPYWELCLGVSAAAELLLTRILGDSRTRDRRIRVTQIDDAQSGAIPINAALSLATGEFVAFLRAGDTLPEHALYELVFELGGNSRADIVYSDHDQIDAGGHRINPWFKPGWDPDLLLSQDYISNLAAYRRTLVEEIGLLRADYEGAEFHDLALRASAATIPDRVRHIPAILYHRRGEDTAIHSENVLPCLRAVAASHRAVRDHLDSRGDTDAVVKPAPLIPRAIRVVWPLPEHPPLVSVIVPTRDRADLLAQCVDGVLHRTDYTNLQLLIVDNGSIEPATHTLFDRLTRDDSRIRVLRDPAPFNYSALVNAAARQANGEILLLLNNDIDVIDSDWMRELVSHALRPDVGIVGAKLLYENEQVQHAGMVMGPEGHVAHLYRLASRNDPGYFGQLALPRTLSAVTGACAAIRRAVFFEVGGLDEVNLPVAFNDVDLCLRLGDYGYRVVWTPFAELFHLESASRGLEDTEAKQNRFRREWQYLRKTWGSLLDSTDPFHNPNLRFAWDHYEIPASPRCRKPWHHIVEQVSNLNRYFPLIDDALIDTNTR